MKKILQQVIGIDAKSPNKLIDGKLLLSDGRVLTMEEARKEAGIPDKPEWFSGNKIEIGLNGWSRWVMINGKFGTRKQNAEYWKYYERDCVLCYFNIPDVHSSHRAAKALKGLIA